MHAGGVKGEEIPSRVRKLVFFTKNTTFISRLSGCFLLFKRKKVSTAVIHMCSVELPHKVVYTSKVEVNSGTKWG